MYKLGLTCINLNLAMPESSAPLLVLCTCPDLACAEQLAHQVVAARLAACVNIIPDLQSIYHWQGQREQSRELLLLLKTTEARYPALEQALRQQHPYQVPEIIALPIVQGFESYLTWLQTHTQPEA